MKNYGSCILKAQMFPEFIIYEVINSNKEKIIKDNNILTTTLFNLYKMSISHNFSLISQRIEEFQNSFEIILSKLKNSRVNFSKKEIAI